MKHIIFIKYGELNLKGKNKITFIHCLYRNLKQVLSAFADISIKQEYDATIISNIKPKDQSQIIDLIKKVPGIELIIPAFITSKTFSVLSKSLVNELKKMNIEKTTFKCNARRQDKTYKLNSMDISRKMGGVILDNFSNFKVDVHKPELNVTIEIRRNEAIFYFYRIKGCGGFPLGINGRVLMLISGGIDSPVAANLLIKKGFHVDFLTFITPPHTDEHALEKVRTLRNIITLNGKLEKSKLYIVNFTNLQHEIAHISMHSYQITIMRRYFFKIAHALALKYHYDAIATGESIGQVASQTIESMQTIQNAVNDFMVLRPLLTYDKSEIISLAKQIGTYETSILPFADCCALFVPTNPTTKPTIHTALKLESELELANSIYQSILDKYITIE
jgi:thiamine biosynthesis protein ThiI